MGHSFLVTQTSDHMFSRYRPLTLNRTLFILGSFLLACHGSPANATMPVAATTTMVADLVAEIGGENVSVTGLMGPGVDPHLYKASPRDLRTLRQAKAIFYNGLQLEGKLGDMFTQLARRGSPVFAVTEGIDRERLLEPTDYEGNYDPHVWFDPILWQECARTVTAALIEVDPANRAYYAARGEAVVAKLQQINTWCKALIETVPVERRILITSHDAYNYFGRAFAFKVVGVQGISTASEAGLADIGKTVEFIRENKVPAIFVETSVSPAAIDRISRDSGATIGGKLFSDAMGRPGELMEALGEGHDVGTYEGMIKYNVATIVEALR